MPNSARLRVEPLEDRVTPVAGALDPTFNGVGITTTAAGPVRQLALVADGRVLSFSESGFVTRFEADGDPDASFGAGGIAAVPGFTNYNRGYSLAAAPDGGAVVGWLDQSGATGNPTTFHLVRLTAAGTVDPTFGNSGAADVVFPGGGGAILLAGVVVRPDGRVVFAGSGFPSGPTTPTTPAQVVVARMTAAGQPDPTFGSGGTAKIDSPLIQYANALDVQADGRVVVAGGRTANPVVVRLTDAGQLDPTFGSGGVVAVPSGGLGFDAVRVLADGRVMLGGRVADGATSSVKYFGTAVRLTPDGRFDPTYDGDGVAVTPQLDSARAGSRLEALIDPAFDPSGRAVFLVSGGNSSFVYRLTAAGGPDTTFGADGQAEFLTTPGPASDVTVQPNGDILLGGYEPSNTTLGLVARLVGVATPAGFTPATPTTFVAAGPTNATVQVLTYARSDGGSLNVAGESAYVAGLGQNLRPAMADVTGDGTPDYVLAAGPGGPPRVVVLDGATGRVAADFAPFEITFLGGAFVAAADLDRDGRAELIVTPDQGGGGRVVVYSVATGGAVTLRASFFGIDDPNFRGGARVTAGDVNRDGTPDVIVAAGFGGGPRVATFGGASVVASAAARLVNDFFAFPGADAERLRNGAYVAAGDRDGDGFADLVFGGGPGGAPRVFILSGAVVSAGNASAAQAAPLANFFSYPVAGDESDRGGVRVAARDVDGDGRADLALGVGAGPAAVVRLDTTANPTAGARFPTQTGVFGGSFLPDGVLVG